MEMIINKQVSLALLLIIVSKRAISNENREPAEATYGFPCTDDSLNCTNSNNTLDSQTTQAFYIQTEGYDYFDAPWYVPNATDIARLLQLPETQDYLNSFSSPLQRLVVEGTLYHCPYIQLCSFSFGLIPSPVLSGMMEPCCQACDCTPGCLLSESCCPDYPGIQLDSFLKSKSSTIEETCMNANIRHRAAPASKLDNVVKAYQTCPHNTDENLNFRCSGQFDLFPNITLDDVTPLSDNFTLKTYRNKHCAICNKVNVEGLSKWQLKLGCQISPMFSSESELLSLILGENGICELTLYPPLHLDVEYCTSNAISNCNVSGEWAERDRDIEKACAGYTTRISVKVNSEQVDYKNPYCAMCNGVQPSAGDFMCNPLSGDPGNRFSFSGLLRSQVTNDQMTPEVKTCKGETLFDEIKKRCRNVTCAFHRILRDRRCEPLFEVLDMMGYRIGGLAEPTIDIDVDQIYDLVPQLRNSIEDYIYSANVGRICSTYTMIIASFVIQSNQTTPRVESIEFRYDVTTEFDHNIEEFVQHLNNLNGMNITINTIVGESVTFNLFLKDDIRDYNAIPYDAYTNWTIERNTPVPIEDLIRLSFEENGRQVIPFFTWNEDPNYCYHSGIIHRLFDLNACSMFTLNVTEIGLQETQRGISYGHDENIVIGLSEYTHSPFDTSMIRVCVDTYKRVFRTEGKRIDAGGFTAEVIVSVVSVSISIICLVVSLFTYIWLPQLQTLPGKNNMALITSLLLAQSMYLLSSFGRLDTDSLACKLVGGFTHFFWLLSIFWMNVCTFHMFRVLLNMRDVSGSSSTKKHVHYHVYCIIVSIVFVTVNILITTVSSEYTDVGYGNKRCYISLQRMIEVTFGIPAAIVVLANLSMFVAIIIKITRAPSVSKNVKHERNYFFVFAKLSTITGVTWLFGFVYMWTGVTVFSYIFIILNGSQGLFMMVSFICNARTLTMFKDRSKSVRASTFGQSSSLKMTTISK